MDVQNNLIESLHSQKDIACVEGTRGSGMAQAKQSNPKLHIDTPDFEPALQQ